jgi:tripartite-type tricarboxylate transporter receptor subunit TctC
MNRKSFLRAALAASLVLGAGAARAADFPDRPLRVVVPFNAGNSTDTIARRMAQLMSKKLNQAVVVENRPGANSAIGAQAVMSAPADGYTIFFGSDSALVLNPMLYKKLTYDPVRDFEPLALAANVPLMMVVNDQVPVKNVKEFIEYAKKNPGKLNYGSTGTGGAFHLSGELFDQVTGTRMVHVPYTGGAPGVQALLAGQIQVMFGVISSLLPHVKSGKLRALALTTPRRASVLPDVPTLNESGYPGIEAAVRYGLVVRKGTPPAVLAVLSEAANYALADPDYRKTFTNLGLDVPEPHPPGQYGKWLDEDRARWGAIIQSRGIQLD